MPPLQSMDVDVTFLNATLNKDSYIDPPTLDKFLREDLRMILLETELCTYVRFNKDRSNYINLAV